MQWRAIACLLALAIMAHLLVMTATMRVPMPCDVPVTDMAQQCDAAHPPPVMRACTVVVQALPRMSLLFLLLIASFIVGHILRPSGFVTLRIEQWSWPPKRRRAFLQVFLI